MGILCMPNVYPNEEDYLCAHGAKVFSSKSQSKRKGHDNETSIAFS